MCVNHNIIYYMPYAIISLAEKSSCEFILYVPGKSLIKYLLNKKMIKSSHLTKRSETHSSTCWAVILDLFKVWRSMWYLLLGHQDHVLQPFPSHQGVQLFQVLLSHQDFLFLPMITLECQIISILDLKMVLKCFYKWPLLEKNSKVPSSMVQVF